MSLASNFCAIPIELIVRMKGDVPFSVYLKLSDEKFVKVGEKADDFQTEIQKYVKKGTKTVYADKIEFANYLKQIKEQEIQDVDGDQLENLDSYFQLAKISLVQLGMSSVAIDLAKRVTDKSYLMIQSYDNLSEFFHQYRQSSRPQFVQNMIVAYMCTAVIDKYDWTSVAIKEKMNLAVMLRDILLSAEDFEELANYSGNKEELSDNVLNHPKNLVEMLELDKDSAIPGEVLTIILQHHEEPDGTGFPNGLRHPKINQLSAIHIIVDRFVTMMALTDFDRKKMQSIIGMIETQYDKGPFAKAFEGLRALISDSKALRV